MMPFQRITRAAARAALLATGLLLTGTALAQEPWAVFPGEGDGPGKDKKIVLISGDEEYRSEEALPQLAKILSKHHGFTCTVLFAYNDKANCIDPTYNKNIPGLEALDSADLMIIFTRYRDLPDEQMQHIDKYLMAGKPVIGIRTATHAFKPDAGTPWEHYGDAYAGDKKDWTDGFGRLVLGEKWISHHGEHKHESTRGRIAPGADTHIILKGIKDGDIWGPTDVYGVRLPLPGDARALVLGEVVKRNGDFDENDLLFGMRPEDTTPVEGAKNDPMMPIAWTRSYVLPGGNPGRCFTTTIGASTDLLNEAVRRMLVNAAYWGTDLNDKLPETGANVELVGGFQPTKFEFRSGKYWRDANLQPADTK
jgi:hypothetical protein